MLVSKVTYTIGNLTWDITEWTNVVYAEHCYIASQPQALSSLTRYSSFWKIAMGILDSFVHRTGVLRIPSIQWNLELTVQLSVSSSVKYLQRPLQHSLDWTGISSKKNFFRTHSARKATLMAVATTAIAGWMDERICAAQQSEEHLEVMKTPPKSWPTLSLESQ